MENLYCLTFSEKSKLHCMGLKKSEETGKQKNSGSEETVNSKLYYESRKKAGIFPLSKTSYIEHKRVSLN